jgi:hypothetical protein
MFGSVRNNEIVVVLGIKIIVVHPNINLIFKISKIVVILLF